MGKAPGGISSMPQKPETVKRIAVDDDATLINNAIVSTEKTWLWCSQAPLLRPDKVTSNNRLFPKTYIGQWPMRAPSSTSMPSPMKLSDITNMLPNELLAFAEQLHVEDLATMDEREVVFAIVRKLREDMNQPVHAEGVLDVLPEEFGFGFVRLPEWNYLAGPYDIYVSPTQIRRFKLFTGCVILGEIRPPKKGERFFALLKIASINSEDAEALFPRSGNGEASSVHAATLEAPASKQITASAQNE
jgi:hypothetical protein